jgi:hypothetical protein
MAKAKISTKKKPKNKTSNKVAKQNRSIKRAKEKKVVALRKKTEEKARRGKSVRIKSEANAPDAIVTTIVVNKKRGFFRNIYNSVIIALAVVKGRVDEDNEKYQESKRTFTEKQKAALLKKVKEQLAMSYTITSTNIYVVNIGFLGLSRPKCLTYINNVVNQMTGNTHYLTPSPTLVSIVDMMALESVTRSAKNFVDADIYLADLKNLLRALCIYIANTCLNNVVILRSAGVRENHKKGASVQPSAPIINGCKDTKWTGEAQVILKNAMDGAQGYRGQYRAMDGGVWGPWISCGYSRGIKITFKELPTSVTLELQVLAMGTEKDSNWSNSWAWTAR